MTEIIIFYFLGCAVGFILGSYTKGVLMRADQLSEKGWVCMGWNFITGPVMIPPLPPRKTITTARDRMRKARQKAQQAWNTRNGESE